MPGVVLPFDQPREITCCICGRLVAEPGVDLYVFWPGEEDPVPAAAHERCVDERTRIPRPSEITDAEAVPPPAWRAPPRGR
jgi:hypothetical protein